MNATAVLQATGTRVEMNNIVTAYPAQYCLSFAAAMLNQGNAGASKLSHLECTQNIYNQFGLWRLRRHSVDHVFFISIPCKRLS